MTTVNELLDNLLKYSYQLSCLNMRQVAADYDYFTTWIQSKDPINPSKHYGVAPAGENTIAPLADNCPIPFTQTTQLVNNCINKEFAAAYTSLINEILLTLKDVYTSDEEVTAINEYIKYTNNVISLLNDGSVVPPTPPAPTLPTVALATYYTGNYVTNCSPGGFLNIYDSAELVPYDSTKTHIARVSDGHDGWLEWQFSCIEYAGDFAIKNMTSDTLSTYAVRLFSCSSTQAEIIYVYNSSNEKYQAFKFTLNETVYYYVADSVQNDWTDDLSNIGYSLEPPVPSEIRGYTTSSGDANVQNVSVSKNGTRQIYNAQGTGFAFDPSYTVSEVFYLDGSNLVAYESPGSFRLFPSEYGLSVRNGFGYTIDIAVVEFVKLEPKKAYINQYSHAADWSYTYNTPTTLYDEDGNTIPYESGKLYTLTASVKADGTIQTHTQWIEAVNVNGALGYRSGVSGNTCYFYYTVK